MSNSRRVASLLPFLLEVGLLFRLFSWISILDPDCQDNSDFTMGTAASIAIPANITFAELLRLVPLLTQSAPDALINTDKLHLYFTTNRNAEGYLSKEKFIELVVSFSENHELRNSIFGGHHAVEGKTLEEITEIHRFRGNEVYSNIHLVDYEVFKNHGSYPCFTDPVHASTHHADKTHFDLTIPADEVNFENAYVIFISHTWFQRGGDHSHVEHSSHAPIVKPGLMLNAVNNLIIPAQESVSNVYINTHPDTEQHDQYRLCLSGLQKFKQAHLTNFDKVYIWMDYSCLDLTPAHIENTLNTISLSAIMSCCDCVFTPLFDPNTDWDFPAEMVHFFEDYNPAPFAVGPGAYLNRAWCRMEAFFANNVALMSDLTHADMEAYLQRHHAVITEQSTNEAELLRSKLGGDGVTELSELLDKHLHTHTNPFANVNVKALNPHNHSRRTRMSQRLKVRANSEQRPHVIYGSYEYRLGLPPLIVSPLSNLYIEKYAPLQGYVSRIDDISEYKQAPATSPEAERAERAKHYTPKEAVVGANSSSIYTAKYSEARDNLDNTHYSVKVKGPQKRDKPSVLRRLNDELTLLMKKGKVGYDGEMNEDGERHGRGIYTYANGEKYIGEWEHGKKQGVGYLQHSNGDVYNGEFHQDHAQGLCTLRYSSGDSYFGELHHGRKSGHGLMEYKTGDVFEGDFLHDQRCGEGVMKYKSGQVYTGCYKDGTRHGYGVLSDAKGAVLYHGYWQHDAQAPDYQPPPDGADNADDEGHHHKHHHKHHHHHHKHHSHSHDDEGTDDADAHDHSHRKHGHRHSHEADANGSVSPTPSDDTSRTASPTKQSQESDTEAAKQARKLEAKRISEKKAQIKSLYESQGSKKVLSIAEIERAHHESVKNTLSPSVKKKKLPAGTVGSTSFPTLPTIPAGSKVEQKTDDQKTGEHKTAEHGSHNSKHDAKNDAHAGKGGTKAAHSKKQH